MGHSCSLSTGSARRACKVCLIYYVRISGHRKRDWIRQIQGQALPTCSVDRHKLLQLGADNQPGQQLCASAGVCSLVAQCCICLRILKPGDKVINNAISFAKEKPPQGRCCFVIVRCLIQSQPLEAAAALLPTAVRLGLFRCLGMRAAHPEVVVVVTRSGTQSVDSVAAVAEKTTTVVLSLLVLLLLLLLLILLLSLRRC